MRFVVIFGALLFLHGCYYLQAVRGQIELLSKREPVEELLADPATPPELRARLELARDIRAFASDELDLPDNDSYTTYVDLGRPYAVWNVVAAAEFSVKPVVWCFPFAGCLPYRGYFSEDGAHEFAAAYRDDGYDVRVSGVTAYSTLGWFADPLLNTMFRYGDLQLAAIVFHELAHQQLYVDDDTAFNEAFATVVEEEGVRRWVEARGKPELLEQYRASEDRALRFAELLREARAELAALYESELSAERMRVEKAAVFERLRERYTRVRDDEWGGYAGYDAWFARDLNNADLAAVATYNALAPELRNLLESVGRDLPAFYDAARDYAATRGK